MISFIIIGRNEGWKLTKCFESVFKTIEVNRLTDSEVIYVDSRSTDDSIDRAKKFSEINIFQITGTCNAAIARNIGAKEAIGDTLFFIDGDMEIVPEFLSLVYTEKVGLKDDFVSGNFENFYYDSNNNLLYKQKQFNLTNDIEQITTGGLFLIKNKFWLSVDGMKTKYFRSQDLDLGLRLYKKGVKLLRKKELLAIHHTISYNDASRMWKGFFNKAEYYRSVLFREHFTNMLFLKGFARENYSGLFFLLTIFTIFFVKDVLVLLPYFLLILMRAFINMKREPLRIPSRFFYFIIRDISFWIALILFWPKNKKIYEYKEVS